MRVNNLDICLEYIKPTSKDDFYYLQILQRKKENVLLTSNSRVIKNYYIKDKEHLLNRFDEIKSLCDIFNARASLRLNKRSFEKVGFKALVNMANSMSNKEYSFLLKSYDRAVGANHNDKDKKWILDVDEPLTDELYSKVKDFTFGVMPNKGEHKVLSLIPSLSGTHIITSPFDLKDFKNIFPTIEVHKDNPVNLYIP